MIASAEEFGNDSPDRLESCLHVGILQGTATVVKTNDIALPYVVQDSGCDGGCGEPPVTAYDRPHDAGEVEFALCFAEAKPADAIRCAEPNRGFTGDIGEDCLGAGEFLKGERRAGEGEVWVGRGVVADLVAAFGNLAGEGGVGLGVFTHLEKRGRYGVAGQNVEEQGRGRGRAVIES